MAIVCKKRFFLSCLSLGVLFLVVSTGFYYLQHFSGVTFLLPGASESLVFRPADGIIPPGVAQRGVSAELLHFDNPRSVGALRRDQNYDGVNLPFALRLEDVEVLEGKPARQILQIDGFGEKREETITSGTGITLENDTLEVLSVTPWEGLVRVPQGEPMAAVEFPGAEGTLSFLESGRSYILQPDFAVRFTWFESEAEARAAFPTRLADVAGARWGVRDRGSIQWFENFIPGTGLVLDDGARITLGEADRTAGYVTLRIERGPGVELVRVAANAAHSEDRYLYDDPAGTGRVFYIHAWREDRAIARLLHREGVEDFDLGMGSDTAPLILRQMMSRAIAVPGGNIRAAQVRVNQQTIALREGLAETVGNYRLLYREEAVPPEARYHITVLDPAGTTLESFSLESMQVERVGAWDLALSSENPFAPQGVAITVERRPKTFGVIIGLALVLLGGLGRVTSVRGPVPGIDADQDA